MKKMKARGMSLILALAMMFSLFIPAHAAVTPAEVSAAITDTAAYLQKAVSKPQVSSIGGEWTVLGLARSNVNVPQAYFQNYYSTVEQYVRSHNGVLHDRKYTEYSRVIVALSAIGKDARNVSGHDLTKPLGDFDKTVWQGINGPIWALIALDSASYPMPSGGATRQMYIDHILDEQMRDGGWSLTGSGSSDPDLTGMALQALAKYQDQTQVSRATEAAISCLSMMQDESGGFSSWGTANSESVIQVIVALTELGLSLDDPRFVKNGHSLLDNLMSFYKKGNGFSHAKADGAGNDLMATEQGLYALVAVQRAQSGKKTLYNMSDAADVVTTDPGPSKPSTQGQGLPNKHGDVKPVPVTTSVVFSDTASSPAAAAIQDLASRAVIGGKGEGKFDPSGDVTRAEFAKIIVLSLGLTPKTTNSFNDVPAAQWYAPYVGAAASYEIVNGKGEGKFDPEGKITRQEAAIMVCRAAKLCGIDTEMDATAIRNMLAQFPDYTSSNDWARKELAVCYQENILSQNELNIRPLVPATREEIAQMVYNLLGSAQLR